MKWPILKEQIREHLEKIRNALNNYEQELNFVDNGPAYSNAGISFTKEKLDIRLMELDDLDIMATKYLAEFCQCGSGLIPCYQEGNEESKCKECFSTNLVESNG